MAKKRAEVQEEVGDNTAEELDGAEQSPSEDGAETEGTQELAQTEEEAALTGALTQDDVVAALTALKETATGKLPALIATYVALKNALGDESPATQNALANLQSYKTEVDKPAKEAKAKVFNEKTALSVALKEPVEGSSDTVVAKLEALKNDARISGKLKTLLVTYSTLVAIEDEALAPSIELAFAQLRAYASKSKSLSNKNSTRLGQPSVRLKTKMVTKDGKTFVAATLAAAIRLLGIEDKVEVHTAWKKINTTKFKAGEIVDFEGHKFSLTGEASTSPAPAVEEQIESLDETFVQEGEEQIEGYE